MASSNTREPARTLLLFCPYDKRVTRHARRGPDRQLVCLDCGRGVEAKSAPASSVQVGPPVRAEAVAPPMREAAAVMSNPSLVLAGEGSRGPATELGSVGTE